MKGSQTHPSVKKQYFVVGGFALLLTLFYNLALVGVGYAAKPIIPHRLTCSPKVVTLDDLLTIEMGVVHAGEFAIIRPDGGYFFVAQREIGSPMVRAIPSDVFRNIVAMKILPRTFVAHLARAGAPDYEPVFNKPGIYKFILGEPLESDVAIDKQVCEVTLVKG
jgi:hypothetical protein